MKQDTSRDGFFERVYEVVEQIPEGMVATYGQVAKRVVFADGRICEGFAFGGAGVQRRLLEDEGVSFRDDDHVDLSVCRWPAGM